MKMKKRKNKIQRRIMKAVFAPFLACAIAIPAQADQFTYSGHVYLNGSPSHIPDSSSIRGFDVAPWGSINGTFGDDGTFSLRVGSYSRSSEAAIDFIGGSQPYYRVIADLPDIMSHALLMLFVPSQCQDFTYRCLNTGSSQSVDEWQDIQIRDIDQPFEYWGIRQAAGEHYINGVVTITTNVAAAVPEPATWKMILVAAIMWLGIGWMLRRGDKDEN